MWLNWLPWRYVVRRVARARGFIDPINLLSHLHRFAQPSEVAAPMELLRAGVVFHARGLMNTGAIQHNLDWVWPYWVDRQFDPGDPSFIPRAFSITHVNLTHRNWTAVGVPDCQHLPIVDPRGLVTPAWDGWSLDGWIITENGAHLVPARCHEAEQHLEWTDREHLAVDTETSCAGLALKSRAFVKAEDAQVMCVQEFVGWSDVPAWLVVALRPYNPEGVSFIHDIELLGDDAGWRIDSARHVRFSAPCERHELSTYRDGDVFSRLPQGGDERNVRCEVGMATAAALFSLKPGQPRQVIVRTPLEPSEAQTATAPVARYPDWQEALRGHAALQIPDERMQFLYDAALRTLVLHSPLDVYPGPYTYKRFWFRDAAFILHALLAVGLHARARRAMDRFWARQTHAGYFLSQEGEWDSNGEALWILERYCQLTGETPPEPWKAPIARGGQWIQGKLLSDQLDKPYAGLLPAGFSAEHLGPNDYYYWDDFWAVAGLRSAARMLERTGSPQTAEDFRRTADRILTAIDRSLSVTAQKRGQAGIPASPHRRMDSGAIGSIVVSYPLGLWSPRDPRVMATLEFLLKRCFFEGGFFQDMIHSGVNPYLTLHVAQALLRAGDERCFDAMQAVARLATSTGQWPEAIHPRTKGGCMGDGQHVWAAAEWLLMIRNCFVREEPTGDGLILCSGVPPAWLARGERISFGAAPTAWGDISVALEPHREGIEVSWSARWRDRPPVAVVALPGMSQSAISGEEGTVVVRHAEARQPQEALGTESGAAP
jgi:hypothetical protein